jgi:hypothetical protein
MDECWVVYRPRPNFDDSYWYFDERYVVAVFDVANLKANSHVVPPVVNLLAAPEWLSIVINYRRSQLNHGRESKTEIKLGATSRLKAQSGEIVKGRVVHLWEDKSVPMVRVASGDLVYKRSGACAG